jgi:hypothetical protein
MSSSVIGSAKRLMWSGPFIGPQALPRHRRLKSAYYVLIKRRLMMEETALAWAHRRTVGTSLPNVKHAELFSQLPSERTKGVDPNRRLAESMFRKRQGDY